MAKKFKCPYCGKSFEREDLVRHIEDKHEDMIPEDYTALRIAFNSINYNRIDHEGTCVICGAPTAWDENKGRYDRLCSKKSCHDTYVKTFEDNMNRTLGVSRISQTVDGQEKMLANRKISGRYKFKDGAIRTYTGSYELEALKFMDQVMECKSEDVMTPGPYMQYEYQGSMHWYISDIYYVPYNLVIEIKDGGDKPNTRNMPDYRARQIAKEKHIIEKTKFNYLRLTNKDFSQLLSVMADLKMQLKDNTSERVIDINENMFAASQGMFPMQAKQNNNVYVVNYLKKNTFTGEPDFAVSDSPRFDSVFIRDDEGKLQFVNQETFIDLVDKYQVYEANTTWGEVCKSLGNYINEFIEEGFIYESVFSGKLYTNDQIKFESKAEAKVDEFEICSAISEGVMNFLLDKKEAKVFDINEALDMSKPELGFFVDKTSGNIFVKENGSIERLGDRLQESIIEALKRKERG